MTINNPEVRIDIIPAFVTAQSEEQKILFIGQKTAAGTAPAGTLITEIGNANEQDTLFGIDSMLASMVRAAKKYNKTTRMDAIVLDDAAGTQATGTFVTTGPATAAGNITFNVGSRKNHSYLVPVAIGDTATDIGDALEALMVADTKAPFDGVNVAGTVTVNMTNDGLNGNFIGLEVVLPIGGIAGVGVTVTAMTGGTVDPVLTSVFSLVDAIRYQTVIFPETYLQQAVAVAFLNDRFNTGTDKLLDGVGIAFMTDTFANFETDTTAANSQSFVLFANQKVDKTAYRGSQLFEINWELAAQFGSVRALRLTPGTDLSEFVTSPSGANDRRGGIHISTLPYMNTPFKNMPIVDLDEIWTDTERAALKEKGWGIVGNNIANAEVIADQIVTRYKTDSAGDPDLSFKFLNYVDQSTTVRDVFHTELKEAYRQFRLTEGDLRPNFNITNAAGIRAEMMKIYNELADQVIVPDGAAAIKKFTEKLVVTISEIEGLVTISMIDPVVTQLRGIDITMQLVFSINS